MKTWKVVIITAAICVAVITGIVAMLLVMGVIEFARTDESIIEGGAAAQTTNKPTEEPINTPYQYESLGVAENELYVIADGADGQGVKFTGRDTIASISNMLQEANEAKPFSGRASSFSFTFIYEGDEVTLESVNNELELVSLESSKGIAYYTLAGGESDLLERAAVACIEWVNGEAKKCIEEMYGGVSYDAELVVMQNGIAVLEVPFGSDLYSVFSALQSVRLGDEYDEEHFVELNSENDTVYRIITAEKETELDFRTDGTLWYLSVNDGKPRIVENFEAVEFTTGFYKDYATMQQYTLFMSEKKDIDGDGVPDSITHSEDDRKTSEVSLNLSTLSEIVLTAEYLKSTFPDVITDDLFDYFAGSITYMDLDGDSKSEIILRWDTGGTRGACELFVIEPKANGFDCVRITDLRPVSSTIWDGNELVLQWDNEQNSVVLLTKQDMCEYYTLQAGGVDIVAGIRSADMAADTMGDWGAEGVSRYCIRTLDDGRKAIVMGELQVGAMMMHADIAGTLYTTLVSNGRGGFVPLCAEFRMCSGELTEMVTAYANGQFTLVTE